MHWLQKRYLLRSGSAQHFSTAAASSNSAFLGSKNRRDAMYASMKTMFRMKMYDSPVTNEESSGKIRTAIHIRDNYKVTQIQDVIV